LETAATAACREAADGAAGDGRPGTATTRAGAATRAGVATPGAAAAGTGALAPYPYDIRADQEPWELDLGPAFVALLGDLKRGTGASLIAARFHETVIAACAETAVRLCAQRGLREVVLSGGVFQNRLLLSGLTRALTAEGLTVHANSAVPCNDGGISLGQVAVALARAAEGELSCA
jgi:hydrogenase maturation protein HypF